MSNKIRIQYEIYVGVFSESSGIFSWPVPAQESVKLEPVFEFQDTNEKNMETADRLLDEWVKREYPGKDYKIYYWWWLK